jgi:hypothetical protein
MQVATTRALAHDDGPRVHSTRPTRGQNDGGRRRTAASDLVVVDRSPVRPAAASRRDRRGTGSEGNDGASCSPSSLMHGPGVQAPAVRFLCVYMEAGHGPFFLARSQLSWTDDATGGGTCVTTMGLGRSRAPAANHVRRGFQNSDGGGLAASDWCQGMAPALVWATVSARRQARGPLFMVKLN